MEAYTGYNEFLSQVGPEIERFSTNSETTTCCATGTCS